MNRTLELRSAKMPSSVDDTQIIEALGPAQASASSATTTSSKRRGRSSTRSSRRSPRDLDIVFATVEADLERLGRALQDLKAEEGPLDATSSP